MALGMTASPARLALATPETFKKIMKFHFGERSIAEGRVFIDMSGIVEDGSSVLSGVSVESPMSETDYVKNLHLFAEDNPTPEIVTFHLSPLSGKVNITTRIRLARSQNFIAVAEMNDGSLYMAQKFIKVTIGGCGGSN